MRIKTNVIALLATPILTTTAAQASPCLADRRQAPFATNGSSWADTGCSAAP
jgi:hypothetical protein